MGAVERFGGATARGTKITQRARVRVVNVLVLWNTIYMDAAVDRILRTSDLVVLDEDLARLSPLEHRNISFRGQHSFALSEAVVRGELRPPRDPGGDHGGGGLGVVFRSVDSRRPGCDDERPRKAAE